MGIDEARLDELDELALKQRRVLLDLLDAQREKRNHQFAILADMGKTRSYITSVSLRWVAEHVRFARDLPVWERKKDDAGRIIVDEETMEELRQREPDWSRQLPMARYIAIREYHKFPPILVAAWKDWVNNPSSSSWIHGVASEDSITSVPLDSKSAYVDLDCEATNFYALDGQHRLMAIRGIRDLLNDRRLDKKTPTGTVVANKGITIEEAVVEREKHNPSLPGTAEPELQSLMNESIGIEIIPAVLNGETSKAALRRLRNIFVHVNRTAKPLSKGTLAQLDEDNGFAIVARRTMVKHKLLKTEKRVLIGKGQVKDISFEYTTLETLVEIAKLYLGRAEPYGDWYAKDAGDLPFRPDDGELGEGVSSLMQYFDLLSRLPSHQELIQDHKKSSADFRKTKSGEEEPNDNILFRPIAQMALADAVRYIVDERELSLEKVMDKLAKAEKKGDLRLRSKKSVWFGVLCDVVEMNMRKTSFYRVLCTQLLIYLLGGGATNKDTREELLDDIRKARRTGDDESCVGYDGTVISAKNLELPAPW